MKSCTDCELSVVIVSYRTQDLLRRCLKSVYANTGSRLEVIVVDNNSQDGSVEMVQREFPQATLICNSENRGFAVANNQGFRLARGRAVVLLNSDTEVTRAALDSALSLLDSDAATGVVGCQLLNYDGSLQLSAGASEYGIGYAVCRMLVRLLFIDKLLDRHASKFIYPGQIWLTPQQHLSTRYVKHVMGACMVVRREVIDRVGGLDEDYFMLMEETDWCFRIRQAGWRIMYLPCAQVFHLGNASMRRADNFLDEQWFFHLYRGRLLFIEKHRTKADALLYKVLLGASVLLRLVPRMFALLFGVQRTRYRRQVRGLVQALQLLWQ